MARRSSVLFAERVLHLGFSVIDSQVGQVGARMSPYFFIHHKVVLLIGLRDADIADVGEIGNRRSLGQTRTEGHNHGEQEEADFMCRRGFLWNDRGSTA